MLHSDDSRVASPQNTSAEETREAQFLDDCRFAKVVRVGDADALLIGGAVILVEGPGTGVLSSQFSLGQKSWADRLATALRKIDVRQTGATDPKPDGDVHQATSAFVGNLRGQIDVARAHVEAYPNAQQGMSILGRTEGRDLIVARLEKRIEALERKIGDAAERRPDDLSCRVERLEKWLTGVGESVDVVSDVVNRCAAAIGLGVKLDRAA